MGKRGCGTRREGGLYAVTETGLEGVTIEHFLIDPPIPFNKFGRAPMLISGKRNPEVLNVIVGVGKSFYPFIPDFVEEAKALGISKRFPRNFAVEKLTPGKSRMILGHPKALPQFNYVLPLTLMKAPDKCPRNIVLHNHGEEFCITDLWSLSALEGYENHVTLREDDGTVKVLTPSVKYVVTPPLDIRPPTQIKHKQCPYCGNKDIQEVITNWGICNQCQGNFHMWYPLPYKPGLFLSVPIHRFDYVSKTGEVPEDLAQRFENSGWRLKVCEE